MKGKKRMKKISLLLSVVLLVSVLLTAVSCAKTEYKKSTSETTTTTTTTTTTAGTQSGGDPDNDFIEHTPGTTHDLVTFFEAVDTHEIKYTYEEMLVDILAMTEWYGDRVEMINIGFTEDGRLISAVRLGDADAERQIVVQAGIHGREYITTMLVMRQLEYYLDNYETGTYNGKTYEELFEDVAIYVIPMANPDGMTIAESGINAIRSGELREKIENIYKLDVVRGYATLDSGKVLTLDEYLEYWKANVNGVDLNRNYDALWEEYKGENAPCFLNYKGPSAASEAETQATVDFVEGLSNVVASITVHSQGEVIYWDCNQSGDMRDSTYELAVLAQQVTGYAFEKEPINDASFSDWMVFEKGIPCITVEVGNGQGYSLLSIDKFYDVWEENHILWAAMADAYSEK